MYFRIFFVLNRVRVSNLQRLIHTQILVQYFPVAPSRALGTRLFPPPRENYKTNCTFLLPDLTYVNKFE